MDEALEEAVRGAGIKWDRAKDWKGRQGRHLGVIMQAQQRHQKYGAQQAKVAWEAVRRLCRLGRDWPKWEREATRQPRELQSIAIY